MSARGSRGSLKGSERPEAGCFGEYRLLLGGGSSQSLGSRVCRV